MTHYEQFNQLRTRPIKLKIISSFMEKRNENPTTEWQEKNNNKKTRGTQETNAQPQHHSHTYVHAQWSCLWPDLVWPGFNSTLRYYYK